MPLDTRDLDTIAAKRTKSLMRCVLPEGQVAGAGAVAASGAVREANVDEIVAGLRRAPVAIPCDSVWLTAAAVSAGGHYRRCVDLFTGLGLAGRRLLVPAMVVAEVGCLLEQRVGPRTESAFLQSMADGDFGPVDLVAEDFARMAQLVAKYDDLPLGTTDVVGDRSGGAGLD